MQKLALFLLKPFGWSLKIEPLPSKKYVLIGAPHTSNWDFIVGLLGLWGGRIRARFLGKKELFRPPLGYLMRALGGIPVDRSRRANLVDQVAEIFRREKEIAILVAPEGTRGKAPYWRTGFYYMALKAGLPIALGYADYRRKEVGIGGYLYPTPHGGHPGGLRPHPGVLPGQGGPWAGEAGPHPHPGGGGGGGSWVAWIFWP